MGDYSQVRNYDFNPLELAMNWVDSGVKNLHIVDLDGAKDGKLSNFETIQKIRKQIPNLYIQMGGGIRSLGDVQKYLDIGLDKVIIGTKAMSDPTFLDEFDSFIFDLTNFLTYVGEPSRADRERIGTYTIFFFIIFTVLSSLLYREFQKDYH